MSLLKTAIPLLLLAAGAAAPMWCATPPQQEVRMAFREPNRPRMIKVDVLSGRIAVRGYDGKEAIITGSNNQKERRFSVVEQNNMIAIGGGLHGDGVLTIQAPFETSLQLRCTNCSEIRVDNIKGDIDIGSANSGIRMYGISGSILANSTNGNIIATMDYVDPSKSHSFISLNGNIDCTFPRDFKANVRMRSENGKIHTDSDIRLGAGAITRTDRGLIGSIGGGGPDVQFRAFNGSIYIRRKQ